MPAAAVFEGMKKCREATQAKMREHFEAIAKYQAEIDAIEAYMTRAAVAEAAYPAGA